MKTTVERPADSAGELYRSNRQISPEQFFQALGRARKAARDEIERLIDWLDSTVDVDASVDDEGCDEDTDAEPSLGSFDSLSNQIKAWSSHRMFTREGDLELDRADLEPSLGSIEGSPWVRRGREGQESWASGNADDREGDGCCDDREGDELQHGGEAEREDDEENDTGIGDWEGLHEQVGTQDWQQGAMA